MFADANQTRDGRTIVSHDVSRMTANFSPKNNNDETTEISFYGRAPSAYRMPSQAFSRPSEPQKLVTNTNDIDDMTREIEEKAMKIQESIAEAKVTKGQNRQ